MRFNKPLRLVAIGAMVGTGALMMLPSGVASAGGVKTVKVTCTTLSGTEDSSSFSGCTPTSAVGSAGTGATTLVSYSAPNFTAYVTWGNGTTTDFGGTLKVTPYTVTKNKDKCPAISGDTPVAEVVQKGAVTAGGTGTLTVGVAVSSTECVYNTATSTYVDLLKPAKF
jgi:hypothetical protein